MTIRIENEADMELGFDADDIIRTVILKTLLFEACPYEVEVNVLLTTDEEIKQTNTEFRGIEKETDCLSFPFVEYLTPSDFSLVVASPMNYLNPENDELLLGDIVISVERAMAQAEEYGHSLQREIGFLTVHSTLHLLGYDHMEEEERLVMEQKQEEILESIGIVRRLSHDERG